MRKVVVRSKCVVACAVLLSVVVTADGRETTPVRVVDDDARPAVAAADRERRERKLPRIIIGIVKSLSDGLTGPRP